MEFHTLLVVFVTITLQPQQTQTSPNDLLLIALGYIKSQIAVSYPECSHLSVLYESHLTSNIHVSHDSTVNLIVDLSLTANLKEPHRLYQYQNRYFYRYHQPCAAVLYEVDHLLLENVQMLNNGTFGHRWPERILPVLPNDVWKSFFIFYADQINCGVSLLPVINDLMDQTTMLRHTLFAIPSDERELNVYAGFPKACQKLKLVATVMNNNIKVIDAKNVYQKRYNFEGESFTTAFCTACAMPEKKLVPSTGNAFNWGLVLTLMKLNATPLVETVFGIPENGLTDEGEFDGFLLPVLEGTTAITSILIPSPKTHHLVHVTRAYWLDSLRFMTALPTRNTSAGLYMIGKPLNWTVWVGIILSSLCLIGSLHLVVLSEGHHINFDLTLWFSSIVYWPLLGQGDFDSKTFRSRAKSWRLHFMVGSWSVALIVLNGAYNSVLWDVIGYPHLVYPPQTFDELDRSDYEIGFIFNADRDLTATNNSRNLRLADRLVEHDFTSLSCFQGILERRMVCIGYYTAFTTLGFEYMVDIHGRMLAEASKDRSFFKVGIAGVSKYYPMLLEPINHYIAVVEGSGLALHSWNYYETKVMKKGQRNAKYYVGEKMYYAGSSGTLEKSEEEQRILGIILRILRGGFIVSAFVLFCEYAVYLASIRYTFNSRGLRGRNILRVPSILVSSDEPHCGHNNGGNKLKVQCLCHE